MMIRIIAALFIFLPVAQAQPNAKPKYISEHEMIQRLILFPLAVDSEHKKIAEDVWWDLRAKLTESKRFLIGSKNFMESKNIFQQRAELKPADAILLGRLLDAHALLTLELKGFELTLRAYDGRLGHLLSLKSLELHPSIPASKQLADASMKLVLDFIASIPYQAHVYIDQIVGRAVYQESDKWRLNAYIGNSHQVSVGDKIQVIQLYSKSLEPLFHTGGHIEVVAEGIVRTVDGDKANIELDRFKDSSLIQENSLIRILDEEKRLKDTYALVKSGGPSLELDALGQSKRLTDQQKERKPLVTAVSFIANIVIMFLAVL